MSTNDAKKYYWVKLKYKFFDEYKMKVLEKMPNGKIYELIYLKLLTESAKHNGNLRFSDLIPYDSFSLSVVINEDKDNVENAIKVLQELELVEVLDDKTIFMTELSKIVGSETGQTIRKRQANTDKIEGGKSVVKNTLEYRDKSKEYRVKSKEREGFRPPLLDEVKAYCEERQNNIDPQSFIDFYESKGWYVGKNKMKDWKACIRTWEQRQKDDTDKRYKEARIKEIEQKTQNNIERIEKVHQSTMQKVNDFAKSMGIEVKDDDRGSKELGNTDSSILSVKEDI